MHIPLPEVRPLVSADSDRGRRRLEFWKETTVFVCLQTMLSVFTQIFEHLCDALVENFSLLILLVARFHVDVRHIYRASIAGKGPPLEALQALLVGCEVEVSAL